MAGNIVVGILRALLTADTAEYDANLQRAAGNTDKFGKDLKSFGSNISAVGNLVMPVSLAIAGIGTAATVAGLDFEKSMNAIQGVLRPTADEMETVRQTAMRLGADTAFSATDAANAMLELGKAGFTTSQAIAAAGDVIQLAAASGLSMGEAAEMAARTLNAFGLQTADLAHVNDVLAKAVNASSLEIGDLQTAFGYIGPIARGFGMSLEQASAALAIMRDNGIAAETAGRALRESLGRLANPVKSVEEAMADLNIKSFESHGKLMNLSQIVELLQSKNITAAQSLKLFGDAAGPAMFALIQQGRPALDGLTEQLKNSDGAAKTMADSMMSGLPGAFEKFKGSAETALLSVFKAIEPALTKGVQLLEQLADIVTNDIMPAFNALSPNMQTTIIAIAGIVAALGPLLVGLGALVAAIGAAMPVLTLIGTAILALVSPIGLIVALLAAWALAWYKWGDDVKAAFSAAKDYIIETCIALYDGIKTYLLDRFTTIVDGTKARVDAVTGFFRDMYLKVVGQSYVPDMVKGIKTEFDKLDAFMVQPTKTAADLTVQQFSKMAQIVNRELVMMSSAMAVTSQNISVEAQRWRDEFVLTSEAISREWQMMSHAHEVFTQNMSAQVEITAHIAEKQLSIFGNLKKGVLDTLGDLWEGMSGGKGFAGLMQNLGGSIVNGFGNILSAGLTSVINMGVNLAIEGVKKIGSLIGGMFKSEESKYVNAPRDEFFAQYGGYEGLAEKLTAAFEARGDQGAGSAADRLIKQIYDADTRSKFASAQAAIVDLIGGQSFATGTPGLGAMDFGAGSLAMLHGREFVVPESRMSEFVTQHGPDQTINIYMDGVLMTQRVVRNMPRVLALHGVG